MNNNYIIQLHLFALFVCVIWLNHIRPEICNDVKRSKNRQHVRIPWYALRKEWFFRFFNFHKYHIPRTPHSICHFLINLLVQERIKWIRIYICLLYFGMIWWFGSSFFSTHHSDFEQTNDQMNPISSFRSGSLQDHHDCIRSTTIKRIQHGTSLIIVY